MKIIHQPEEVWQVFLDMQGHSDSELLAENEECGIKIWLDLDDKTSTTMTVPVVSVENDGLTIDAVCAESEDELIEFVEDLYEMYLDETAVAEMQEVVNEATGRDIEEREEDLNTLVSDFIIESCQTYSQSEEFEEIVRDLKEHFLAYMYRKHGLSPYRPMFVKVDGKETFMEYPYPVLCS